MFLFQSYTSHRNTHPLIRSRKPLSISMNLCQVIHDAVEQPLRIHLSLSPQSESIQPHYGKDVGKWRLSCLESSIVDKTTSYRIDLAFHLLCECLRSTFSPSHKEVDLACFAPISPISSQIINTSRNNRE